MRIFSVVTPILVSVLLAILLSTVSGLAKRVDDLETAAREEERWRGEISAISAANGAKVDKALIDMGTTNQLLNDIRVDLARRRP